MSDNDYEIFWTETIRQLVEEEQLTDGECKMWFRCISFLEVKGNSFILQVPSKFYRQQMKIRYLDMLETKLRSLIDPSFSIEFQIKEIITDENLPKNQAIHKKPNSTNPPNRLPHKQLRQDYIFDNFVIGNNNDFATNVAYAISKNPGNEYNPFLIYGGVGLGKTHLMQAIGNYIHNTSPDKKVVFITAETFINEFIQSIKTSSQSQFKNKYRRVDILLIDDIHDFHNKKETQEELFHTFNVLYDAKKQLVFTCDRPPSELQNFTARLKSRFEYGLSVDIHPPDFETRYAILRKKLETSSFHIPEEVIELIAQKITTNVRDLEASLKKMVAYSELIGKNITIDIAKQQLKNTLTKFTSPSISINNVQKTVSDYFNITLSDMKSKKRNKHITFPRQVAMYLIREITNFSTTEIGMEFGGRDHTTVMHSCQKIEDMMKADPTLEPIITTLAKTIKNTNNNE